MTIRSSFVFAAWSAITLLAVVPSATLAHCPESAFEAGPVDMHEFEELTMEPGCDAIADAVAKRLEADPSQIAVPPESDPEEARTQRHEALVFLQLRSLREVLARGERDEALQRARQLLADGGPDGLANQVLNGDAPFDDPGTDYTPTEPTVIEILEGKIPSVPRSIQPVEPDWTLTFGACGNPAFAWYLVMVNLPTTADAWLGMNRPDLALNALLAEQWNAGLSVGITPPRLREFGERLMGLGTYPAEVERALAGIRITNGPDGRRATLPMYGESLPLPLAFHLRGESEPTVFRTPADIAAYLRPRLLHRE